MEKIVISVSKGYQNSRGKTKYGTHPRAKPVWYAFILENDVFKKVRISILEVPAYKMQIRKKRDLICNQCDKPFVAYVKNNKEKVDCPYCNT